MSDHHASHHPCGEMHLLIQADLDGELEAGQSAAVARHVAGCAECAALQQRLGALSTGLRTGLPYHAAPAALREAVAARLAPAPRPRSWFGSPIRRLNEALSFGAGFAVAAAVALALVLPRGPDLTEAVVAGHIRALQPGHLMDVVSTDQHTVKPWFDGRLDFAPPVKDLAAAGFPLTGARLDYLSQRPVAALLYQRAKHEIDLFIWPGTGSGSGEGERSGYNFVHWTQGGMEFWAVSDLEQRQLEAFAELWRKAG
ncbi:MAG: anti-sigma factor [Acidisphaera sp.]|nr:anti-sigma factor [Acidisphaera sp.]